MSGRCNDNEKLRDYSWDWTGNKSEKLLCNMILPNTTLESFVEVINKMHMELDMEKCAETIFMMYMETGIT